MKDILIYSTAACPYCIIAKRALDNKGIPYREIDITLTPHVRGELHAKTGERTVPQVFVDGIYIGQDDELVEMVESGALSGEADTDAAADEEDFSVAIVGGGITGLTAACDLAGLGRVAVFDRAPHAPGRDPHLDRLRDAAGRAGVTLMEKEVFGLETGDAIHRLVTVDQVFACRTVVIATGARERADLLPGEADLLGKGASHCAECDGAFFPGMDVAVAGGDARAAKAALHLAGIAGSVHLLAPGDMDVSDAALSRLQGSANVTLHPHTRINAIQGQQQVSSVTLDGPEGEGTLSVAGVFLYLYGNRPVSGFLKGAVATGTDGAVTVDPAGRTSVPGILAVGPVAEGATGSIAERCRSLTQTVADRLAV